MELRVVYRRLAQGIPVLFGVSFLTFALLNALPGDTAQAILGPNATPDSLRVLRAELHLNEPFFQRYFDWLGGLLTGHLGSSLVDNQSISSIIGERLPVTFEIVLLSSIVALAAAIPVALLAAYRPRAVVDRLSMVMSMTGLSVPGFVFAILLILVFAVHLRVLPATGFVPLSHSVAENLKDVTMPVITLAFGIFCGYTRILRGDLIDQMNAEDYVVVAKAKGLSERRVLFHHAFRNSVFPLMTLVGLHFATLLSGTVIVEQIFALPGMGQELLNSIYLKDIPVVQAIVVMAAAAVVVANLITDLMYSVLDPRVRYGSPSR